MSGLPDNVIAAAAEHCGANAWTPKPVGRSVIETIEEVLSRRTLLP